MKTIPATGYKMDKTFITTIPEKAQNVVYIPMTYTTLEIVATILSAHYYVVIVMSHSILCYWLGAT